MTQAEMNAKAMSDIFAIEDATPVFESIGNSLDLGLDPVEDDTPKSFDDLLEVNPSSEPSDSEMFMQENDDLQDPETQKFIVDRFAKVAMERSGGVVDPDVLDDVSVVVHGLDMSGDVRGFLEKAMWNARSAQQSQNVSDAQPEGTVADFGNEDAAAAPAADAAGGEIAPMDPIAATAEPTLEPNVGDTDGLGGLDAGLGAEDPLAPADDSLAPADDSLAPADDLGGEGLDVGGDEGLGDEGTLEDLGSEGDPDGFADPENNDKGTEGDDELGELDAGNLEGLDDLDTDDDLGDEDKDQTSDEPKEDDSKEEKDDFDFESIAKKASGLMEAEDGTPEVDASVVEEKFDEGQEEGTAIGAEGGNEGTPAPDGGNTGGGDTDTPPVEECGDVAPNKEADPVLEAKKAKCEAISTRYKIGKVADTVHGLIESYNNRKKLASTVARMEAIVNDFKEKAVEDVKETPVSNKSAQIESIIGKYAKASAENAHKAELKSIHTAMMESVENAKKAIQEKKAKNDQLDAKLESIVNDAAKTVKAAHAVSDLDAQLNSILESVKTEKKTAQLEAAKKSEADALQKELDAIVESVRNA